jgi:hypothetical protein
MKDKEGQVMKVNVTFFKMKAIGIYEHLKTADPIDPSNNFPAAESLL